MHRVVVSQWRTIVHLSSASEVTTLRRYTNLFIIIIIIIIIHIVVRFVAPVDWTSAYATRSRSNSLQ